MLHSLISCRFEVLIDFINSVFAIPIYLTNNLYTICKKEAETGKKNKSKLRASWSWQYETQKITTTMIYISLENLLIKEWPDIYIRQ